MPCQTHERRVLVSATMLCILTAVVIALVPFSDGEDGDVGWSDDVVAVVFDNENPRYFTSIQDAVGSIESGTVYIVVKDGSAVVPLTNTIVIGSDKNITITGLDYDGSDSNGPQTSCAVTLLRSGNLTDAMVRVSGTLTLENVNLDGGSTVDESGNISGVVAHDAAVFVEGGSFTLGAGSSIKNNCIASEGVATALHIEGGRVDLGGSGTATIENNIAYGTDSDSIWAPIVMDSSSIIQILNIGNIQTSNPFIWIKPGSSQINATPIAVSNNVSSGFDVYIEPSTPTEGFITNNGKGTIKVTLAEGFPLGTKIGTGEIVNSNDVDFHEHININDSVEKWYLNSILDSTDEGIRLTFTEMDNGDETSAAGVLVRLYDDADIVKYAGFTDEYGVVKFDAPDGEYRITTDEYEQPLHFEFNTLIRAEDSTEYKVLLSEPDIVNDDTLRIDSHVTHLGSASRVLYTKLDSPSILKNYVYGSILLELDIQPQDSETNLESIKGLLMTRINLSDLNIREISNPLVLRIHNGSVEQIPKDYPNEYGEYFTLELGFVDLPQLYITIYSNRFSTYAIADGTFIEPAPPSPPVERTYVWAAIEDRQVRISVDPESGRQYCVKDSAGNELTPWNSAHNGSTFSFDLLSPGADYSVVSRYSTSGAERTDAVIRAPIDPSIVIDSVSPDRVSLVAEDGAEYRLTGPGFAGEWTSDPSWSGLDPSADYYAEARSVSGSLSITTGPEVVKPGLEVAGAARHDEVRVALSLPDGWTFSVADGLVATGNSLGPVPPGILQVEVNPPAGTGFTFELLIPEIPEDSPDTAESVSFESQEGVMYLLTDSSGADAGDGWVQGGGTLSWTVDPDEGYFLSMSTETDGISLTVAMIEVKRPSEAAGFVPR